MPKPGPGVPAVGVLDPVSSAPPADQPVQGLPHMGEPHGAGEQPGDFLVGYADARFDLEHDRPPRDTADRSPDYRRGYAHGYRQTLIVERLRRLEESSPEDYYVDLGSVRRLLELSSALLDLLDGFDLAPTLGGVDARRRSPEKAAVSQTLQYLERLLGHAQALVGVEYHRLRNMPDVVDLEEADFAALLASLRELHRAAGRSLPSEGAPGA
jgi:hypothetical protein